VPQLSLLFYKLQRFALKPKPSRFLKALLCNAFKNLLLVRLIGDCYKSIKTVKAPQSGAFTVFML
jgi:hypothetical protein